MAPVARATPSARLARVVACLASLACAMPAHARGRHEPLPIYIEDNHAGAFQFLAQTLELDQPHVLVLVDAHSDSSVSGSVAALRQGVRRVASPAEREAKVGAWRRDGTLQSFDWIVPLMPAPLARVLWVPLGRDPSAPTEALPSGFARVRLDQLPAALPADLPVVASIDLDAFTGLAATDQAARFGNVWSAVTRLPRLAVISVAISRPWLEGDEETSRLLLLVLRASFALGHASVRLEPWGLEGPDRSDRAKTFYRQRRQPPRFDPETASPELRSLVVSHAEQLEVPLQPARWEALLDRWRAERGLFRVRLEGLGPDSDGIFRLGEEVPALRIEAGLAGTVQRVTWLSWTPAAGAYNVLPELPAGKSFVGVAPPLMEYRSRVLSRGRSLDLPAEAYLDAFPGPGHTGVLRLSAKLETDSGVVHTARVELRRGLGHGLRAGLSEQFGLPYVFGAGFLRRDGLRGPDTGVGNDCANFLVHAFRRSGLRMPWSNPAQLRTHLVPLAKEVIATDRVPLPGDALDRGLVVHLGSHVAALWEDRTPMGTLGPEDQVVHHLGRPPEVLSLAALLRDRERPRFDVYLGPARAPVGWIAVGGDVMPGAHTRPPQELLARLRAADLAAANLETTVGKAGQPARKRYVFQVPGPRLAALRELGLDGLSLANNHAGDFGAAGLAQTLAALDEHGLGAFGAGKDVTAATSAWFATVKGQRVAFVSASLTDPDLLPAGPGRPGVAVLPSHEHQLAASLATARSKASCVIALPHWGTEGSIEVTLVQRRWARWLVEHGADAVVGSGPHVLQASEFIEGVPVFYSVGNLWFEGRWPAASRISGLALLGLDGTGRIVASRLDQGPPLAEPPRASVTPPGRTAP